MLIKLYNKVVEFRIILNKRKKIKGRPHWALWLPYLLIYKPIFEERSVVLYGYWYYVDFTQMNKPTLQLIKHTILTAFDIFSKDNQNNKSILKTMVHLVICHIIIMHIKYMRVCT